jgi:hypothetical protein
MPFDWQQFQVLAEQLIKAGGQAEHRSAISRAYYCTYNLLKHRAQQNGVQFSTEAGFHKQLWSSYKRGPDPNSIKIGVEGERLHELRVRADYIPEFARLDEQAA